VLFTKITVLKVPRYIAPFDQCEAPKFVYPILLAVIDPVQNLTFRILGFRKDRISIDAQRSVQTANSFVRSINRFELHVYDNSKLFVVR